MCRLYGFSATEPTKVECSLVHAQNALLVQSRSDESGRSHSEGWGLGTYVDGRVEVERQAWPAYQGETFRAAAARIYSTMVIAHIRRATVGAPAPENTHPFSWGRWLFAHNGTIGAFPAVEARMLERMSEEHRTSLRGTTDSERLFHFLQSLQEEEPERPLVETLRAGLRQVVSWSHASDATAETSLNVLWTNGEELVGSRLGRSLWYTERDGIRDCEICGFPHVRHRPEVEYRAATVASERITSEVWHPLPDRSVFRLDATRRILLEAL